MMIYTIVFEIPFGSSEPSVWFRMFKMRYATESQSHLWYTHNRSQSQFVCLCISSLLDENTICGYFSDVIINFIAMHAYIITMTAGVGYFLSVCFYLEAFCMYCAIQLNKFDEMVLAKDKNNSIRIQTEIFQCIKFHIKIVGQVEF